MKDLLTTYLKSIAETTKQGDAREESYYPALKELFTDFPLEKGRRTIVTVIPKATEAGIPDFRVWDGDNFIVGYIEAKTPGTNLDLVETSEQLQRYLQTFPNVILTDFYEFRLYRDGVNIDQVTIARSFTAQKLKTTPKLEHPSEFQELAERFFSYKLPLSYTAESLAVQLAKRTRFLRDQVVSEELKQAELQKGGIYGFYQAFQKYLLPNLTPKQFADLYSQTITYGLFAARTRSETSFTRRNAVDFIPSTVGILRDVFQYISLERISDQMEVIIDDIVSILNVADINNILDQYYHQGKGEDPIVHFYETFLNEYDPQTRERRGVYYTPEPVVKYIVKSVHQLLKTHFNLPDGLADSSVTLLDPAAGTMTFPAEAIKLAVQEYVQKYGEGGKKEFIGNQILRNFYAFELMMAPYAIGHMKISLLLDSLGYQLGDNERFNLYLTNTLEMEEIQQIAIPGVSSLSEESHLAGKVKKDEPVMVIMGNPPYSGISSNINEWTEKLLKEDLDGAQSYYKVDGKPLGEKKVWLQDDYVKFLRFAQWKIQKAGKGIVAMITNHAYLDNPTFRGMRQSLMKTFDEIYVLDLHGNSLKKEIAPDGGKDENVFDIRTGVSIAFFVKNSQRKDPIVWHTDLFGDRHNKYDWLDKHDFESVKYNQITTEPPYYFFVPSDTSNIKHYASWLAVNEIFPVNVTGVLTARDKFAIDFDKNNLLRKVRIFQDLNLDDVFIKEALNLSENYAWKIDSQRREFQNITNLEGFIKKIQYRPFDDRFIFYQPNIVFRMREEVMRHMLNENIGLSTVRQVKTGDTWQHCLVTTRMIESCFISNRTSEIGYIFPLFIYPEMEQTDLFNQFQTDVRANIQEELFGLLLRSYKTEVSPKEIFSYVYAILHSNIYRKKYFVFLRSNFPRIPFTSERDIFMSISFLGQRLIDLHLLKSSELEHPVAKYQGTGDDHVITRPKYSEIYQRLYINSSHYFEGLTPEVWNYQIGGYQVLDKYLKDRKGRRMDDPRYFIRVATALAKTIEIQKEIDAIYPEVEKNVISFKLSD